MLLQVVWQTEELAKRRQDVILREHYQASWVTTLYAAIAARSVRAHDASNMPPSTCRENKVYADNSTSTRLISHMVSFFLVFLVLKSSIISTHDLISGLLTYVLILCNKEPVDEMEGKRRGQSKSLLSSCTSLSHVWDEEEGGERLFTWRDVYCTAKSTLGTNISITSPTTRPTTNGSIERAMDDVSLK